MTPLPCPCGSGDGYADCCRGIVRGEVAAATAEALMRSRYTAYVRRDAGYLLRSWHPSTAPESVDVDDAVWLGLDVVSTEAGTPHDDAGIVEFVARYQLPDGSLRELHETSRFVRERGAWLYVSGDDH